MLKSRINDARTTKKSLPFWSLTIAEQVALFSSMDCSNAAITGSRMVVSLLCTIEVLDNFHIRGKISKTLAASSTEPTGSWPWLLLSFYTPIDQASMTYELFFVTEGWQVIIFVTRYSQDMNVALIDTQSLYNGFGYSLSECKGSEIEKNVISGLTQIAPWGLLDGTNLSLCEESGTFTEQLFSTM